MIIFPGNSHHINLKDEFENYIYKSIAASSKDQWVKAKSSMHNMLLMEE